MFILARSGATSARLRFNVGPQADQRLDAAIDYAQPFAAADTTAWQAEYEACVRPFDVDPWLAESADDAAERLAASAREIWCGREWFDRAIADPLFPEEDDFFNDPFLSEEDAWQTRLAAVPG